MTTNTPISSITKGPRQSNMELLRILAMFLILTVHADFWALGAPTQQECYSAPLSSLTRILIESIAILSVNVFVLISGWFTIRPSVKGFCDFIFQCAFFFIGIYAVLIFLGLSELSVDGLRICLLLTPKSWFIKAYTGLYILSPVLNIFCEKASKRQLAVVITAFFIFQTIYGVTGTAKFIESGYSTFSFIGLYLLARYIRRYTTTFYKWGGRFFLSSIVLNTVFCFVWTVKIGGSPWFIYNYVNPLVIIGSLGLLLAFSHLKLGTNKVINWIAASSFAAFLTHGNPNLGTPYFKPYIQHLYNSYNGVECLGIIFISLVAIFAVSALLDQPRKWLWIIIAKILPDYKL